MRKDVDDFYHNVKYVNKKYIPTSPVDCDILLSSISGVGGPYNGLFVVNLLAFQGYTIIMVVRASYQILKAEHFWILPTNFTTQKWLNFLHYDMQATCVS